MNLLGIDAATAAGCCDGFVGGKPRSWSWYLSDAGDDRPVRLAMLMKFLRAYFEKEPCDAVVYEQPLPLGMLVEAGRKDGRIMSSEKNLAFSRGAIGVIEATCAEHGKRVSGVAVMDARSSVLGWRTNRTSEGTKDRVLREVTTLLKVDAQNHNEADAYVIWAYACALQNPRLAVMNTPLFRGSGA